MSITIDGTKIEAVATGRQIILIIDRRITEFSIRTAEAAVAELSGAIARCQELDKVTS